MYEIIIRNYINNLTKYDIKQFAKKEGINIEEYEVNILYDYIKKYWEVFFKGDPEPILADLKDKVRPHTYNKIIELYNYYKKMI